MQIEQKELTEIVIHLAQKKAGVRTRLAKYIGVKPPNVTYYLKHGDIPDKRYKKLKKFIELNKD